MESLCKKTSCKCYLQVLLLLITFVIAVYVGIFVISYSLWDDTPQTNQASQAMLYGEAEEALISDQTNLYRLRNIFFPISSAEPIVVEVTYNVTISLIPTELCPGATNGLLEQRMNETNATSNSYSYHHFWTNSVAFSVLNPHVIDLQQPTVIFWLSPITRSYNVTSNSVDLFLGLNLTCEPSKEQMTNTIKDLTTRLKAYANAQGIPSSWNSDYKGYTTEDDPTLASAVFFTPVVLLMAILVLLCVRLSNSNWFKKYLTEECQKKEYFDSVLLSTYSVISIVNFVFIFSEIMGFFLWLSVPTLSSADKGLLVAKWLLYLFCCGLCIPLAIFVGFQFKSSDIAVLKKLEDYAEVFSLWSLSHRLIYALCRKVQRRTCTSTLDYSISNDESAQDDSTRNDESAQDDSTRNDERGQSVSKVKFCIKANRDTTSLVASKFLIFAVILIWSFTPTLLLIFINPVETLAVVSLLCALFILTVIGLTLASVRFDRPAEEPSHEKNFKCTKSNENFTCWCTLTFVIVILFAIVVACVLGLFIYLLKKGVGTGGVLGILLAFLPTAITGSAAWLAKGAIQKFKLEKKDGSDNQAV